MIFKNLTALCRAHKRIVLFGDPEELQWVGDGSSLYPLHGMPGMEAEELPTVFDVPEKDRGKYLVKTEDRLPGIFCYKDLDPRGETQLRPEPWMLKRYDTILCPVQTSRGLRFYDPEYLKPLKDLQNTLEIYERRTTEGQMYFAVKSGMLLQAILLPLVPEYGKLLDELLELCSGLQQTVESMEIRDPSTSLRFAQDDSEGEAKEIEGQICGFAEGGER